MRDNDLGELSSTTLLTLEMPTDSCEEDEAFETTLPTATSTLSLGAAEDDCADEEDGSDDIEPTDSCEDDRAFETTLPAAPSSLSLSIPAKASTLSSEIGFATPVQTPEQSNTPTSENGVSRSNGCGKKPSLASGTRTIKVNGQDRQYILDIPDNYDSNQGHKLIFGFHWLSGTMNDVVNGGYYGLKGLAENGAIFVAPQGFDNGWANTGGRDLALVDELMKTIEAELCIDTSQRFATGFSYGGGMSYSLACSRASSFRAVAVRSGAQLSGCDGGNTPIAYLGMHGISDTVLSIEMGRSLRDKFVRNNGCQALTPEEPSSGSKTHIKTEFSCKSGYPVTWIAYDGGHDAYPKDNASGNGGNNDWASTETWEFFSQFS